MSTCLSLLRRLAGPIALSCACAGGVLAADDDTAATHRAALDLAARGDYGSALERLARLSAEYPTQPVYLHDYVSVLQRAGRHDAALALAGRVDAASAPAYALESLAAAATATRRFDRAESLYASVLARFPGRREALEGMAAAGAERVAVAGALPARASDARQSLSATDRLAVMSAEAALLERKALFYPALRRNQEILALVPGARAAQAGLVRIAARLGASHQAAHLAARYPQALDAQQRDALERNRTAVDARWAERLRALPRRYADGSERLDGAIARSDELARTFMTSETPMTEAQLRWLHDRLVLLGSAGRAQEAVALHQRFARRGLPVPGYALRPVADSYMRLRQPTRATALYERVLREAPEDADARVGMYFALLESEAHEQAYAWVDEWARRSAAAQAQQPGAATRAQAWDARLLQARSREFAGELGVAQAKLETMQAEAPANAGVRAARAAVYRSRGWPRKAWETWQLQLLHDPHDVDAYAESVYPLLDAYRFGAAGAQLAEAQRRQPDANSVRRAARAWKIHNRPELAIQAEAGRSDEASAPSGLKDGSIDLWLYSAPIKERFRAYLHGHYAGADLAAGAERYKRGGLGLEYRAPDLRLFAEAHAGRDSDSDAGVLAGGRWWLGDVWNVAASADTRTQDVPLQARQAGIDARQALLEIEARIHESRAFAALVKASDFSDDNDRLALQLSWREGWVVRPRWWLSSRVDLYTSHNSRDDAPYFNPSKDRSASLSLTGGLRTWRWYEREFVQELTVSGGSYWQEDFGSGGTWGLEYAHRWQLDDRFYLRYALGRTTQPYDGAPSRRNYVTLDLDWRF